MSGGRLGVSLALLRGVVLRALGIRGLGRLVGVVGAGRLVGGRSARPGPPGRSCPRRSHDSRRGPRHRAPQPSSPRSSVSRGDRHLVRCPIVTGRHADAVGALVVLDAVRPPARGCPRLRGRPASCLPPLGTSSTISPKLTVPLAWLRATSAFPDELTVSVDLLRAEREPPFGERPADEFLMRRERGDCPSGLVAVDEVRRRDGLGRPVVTEQRHPRLAHGEPPERVGK